MVFSRGKIRNIPRFVYNNQQIEVVSEFKYLGIVFNHNGTFILCKQHLCQQAEKAMYSLLRKNKKLGLSIDLQLELFDNLMTPILLCTELKSGDMVITRC